jgi:hypothetical protein
MHGSIISGNCNEQDGRKASKSTLYEDEHAIRGQASRSSFERRAKNDSLKDVLAEAFAGELVRNRPHTRFDLGDNFRLLGPDKA